jgi:feruloyl-CoA synthase
VSVGTLRPALLSEARGLLRDAVLTGHDAGYVAALVWLDPAEGERAAAPAVRQALLDALDRLNRGASSSGQVRRLLPLEEPPSLDAGEITDKGYVNQRAVLERCAELVRRLHQDPPPPGTVRWD